MAAWLPPWLPSPGLLGGYFRRAHARGATAAAQAHATKAAYASSTYGCRPKMILLSWATAAAPFWQCVPSATVAARQSEMKVKHRAHINLCLFEPGNKPEALASVS